MAKSQTLVQVDLQSGTTLRTCWVEPQVKIGDAITLDEPDRLWSVLRVGSEAPRNSIHTDWHNNI